LVVTPGMRAVMVAAWWLGRTEVRCRPFGSTRFLGPSSEPDGRVPSHPALPSSRHRVMRAILSPMA
jgi:hypothetical protein